jgi:hypothetical protein
MDMEEAVDLLATAKRVHKGRLAQAFTAAPKAGLEVSAGFVMDSTRDDIDNLTRLRDRLLEVGTTATTVTIRDKSNEFHTVTVAELSEIVGELVDFGLGLYEKKWQREAETDAATTIEEVEAIGW